MKLISFPAIILVSLLSATANSTCFDVSVTVNERNPDDKSWDANGGLPDVKVCFQDDWGYRCKVKGEKKAFCGDTLTCNLGLVYFSGSSTKIEITDVDIRNDDPIATKTCTIGESCNLGNAKVEFKAASCE